MWWARLCQASYPVPVTGLVIYANIVHEKHIGLSNQVKFSIKSNTVTPVTCRQEIFGPSGTFFSFKMYWYINMFFIIFTQQTAFVTSCFFSLDEKTLPK